MIEELIEAGEIFSHVSKEGLCALAIGYLLEKSKVPNCFDEKYSKTQEIHDFIPNIENNLKKGIMANFWEKTYGYAIQNKGFGEKIQYALMNWLPTLREYVLNSNKLLENSLHKDFLEVFKEVICNEEYNEELSKEKAKYRIYEIALLSFLPKEFESDIKERRTHLIKKHKDFQGF